MRSALLLAQLACLAAQVPVLNVVDTSTVRGAYVWALAFRPIGPMPLLASASSWDLDFFELTDATGQAQLSKTWNTYMQDPTCLAYSPDGARIAIEFASSNKLYVYTADSAGNPLGGASLIISHASTTPSGALTGITFSPDGATIAAVDMDKKLTTYAAADGALIAQRNSVMPGNSDFYDQPYSVAYSPDGAQIATCGGDGKIYLWDAASLDPILTSDSQHGACVPLPGSSCEGSCRHVGFDPSGTRLLSAGLDKYVMVWDAQSLVRLHAFQIGSQALHAQLSPDGAYLAVAGQSGYVGIVHVPPSVGAGGVPTEYSTLSAPGGSQYAVSWSPDMTMLATGGASKTLTLWSTALPTYTPLITIDTPPASLLPPPYAPPPPPPNGGSNGGGKGTGTGGSGGGTGTDTDDGTDSRAHVLVEHGASVVVRASGKLIIGSEAQD